MSSEPVPRPANSFGLWLAISLACVIAAALFSATKAKPPVIFLLGFGAATGFVLRLLADTFSVRRGVPVVMLSMLLVGAGAILCFVPSYQKAARIEVPDNPLAAAMLKQLAQDDPDAFPRKYTVGDYLAQRYAHPPPPWPPLYFGGEWLGCVLTAALFVGFGRATS